jgi:hypothetical protein
VPWDGVGHGRAERNESLRRLSSATFERDPDVPKTLESEMVGDGFRAALWTRGPTIDRREHGPNFQKCHYHGDLEEPKGGDWLRLWSSKLEKRAVVPGATLKSRDKKQTPSLSSRWLLNK